MYETLNKYLEGGLFSSSRDGLSIVSGNEGGFADTTYTIMASLQFLIMNILRHEDWTDILRNGIGDVLQEFTTDMDTPRYGWYGYDEEAAIETLYDNLDIPETTNG